MLRSCLHCSKQFEPTRADKRLCSPSCRSLHSRAQRAAGAVPEPAALTEPAAPEGTIEDRVARLESQNPINSAMREQVRDIRFRLARLAAAREPASAVAVVLGRTENALPDDPDLPFSDDVIFYLQRVVGPLVAKFSIEIIRNLRPSDWLKDDDTGRYIGFWTADTGDMVVGEEFHRDFLRYVEAAYPAGDGLEKMWLIPDGIDADVPATLTAIRAMLDRPVPDPRK